MAKYTRNTLKDLDIDIQKPCIIFLYGDLGAGKTTLSQHIIQNVLGQDSEVTSPTYTYYNKIGNTYHFDLYRLDSYENFVSIGGEEIFDNNEGIILVEWPQILLKHYTSDIDIYLEKTDVEDQREIKIVYN